MENKKNITIIAFAVFSIAILLSQQGINYAYAVSTANVTFATGTTTVDVSYDKSSTGADTSTAYIIGQNAGQAYVWKKAIDTQVISGNVTLTGSGTGKAIAYNQDNFFVYAVTNDKFYKISTSLGIAGSLASGTANVVIQLYYSTDNEVLYYCTNDGYGSINVSTLALTTLYTDPQTNGVLGCTFDIGANLVYLSGVAVGTGLDDELITINLSTHTQVSGVSIGTDFFYGVCADTVENKLWAMDANQARVRKYDSLLNQEALVTVGTTPRHCSINTDDTGRRLYVANEGTNTISILDIDANAVLSSPAVCDTVAGRKIDTKRLFNVTNTFVTCNSNVNSVVIDDTVSDFIPPSVTPSTGIDCDLPENVNILICRLGGDGTLGSAGAFVIGNTTDGTGVLGIGCSIGLVDCTDDPNPQTNGLGLLIFIASIFVIVGMFYRSLGAQATFQLPVFLWVIIIVALSAFFTITNIIDPIFLILSIVAVIALAVPKVIGVIQNRSFGGGGSSE